LSFVCAETDPDMWFDEKREAEAKALCGGCWFKSKCAELGGDSEFGVFGGLNPAERGVRVLRPGDRVALTHETIIRLHDEGMPVEKIGGTLGMERDRVLRIIRDNRAVAA
jgi:hypothetical protein